MFSPLEPVKFDAGQTDEIALHMQEYGYVVIRDMIDQGQLQSLFKQDLREVNRNLPENFSLWSLRAGVDYPNPRMPGLTGEWGLSQGRAAWAVRCNKGIQQVFSNLLYTENLVCSSDAIGFSTDTEKISRQSWLHVDQNPNIPTPLGAGVRSLQGIVYAEDTQDPDGASTVLAPLSHRLWKLHDFKSRNHFKW